MRNAPRRSASASRPPNSANAPNHAKNSEFRGPRPVLHSSWPIPRRRSLRRRELNRITTTLGAAILIWRRGRRPSAATRRRPVDPFAPAASASTAPAGGATSANPFRAGVASEAGAAARDGGTTPLVARPSGQSRRELADQALLDARRALSVGDLPRAQQFLAQAEQLEVAYDGPGDSPQNVAESIRQGQELAELRKSPGGGVGVAADRIRGSWSSRPTRCCRGTTWKRRRARPRKRGSSIRSLPRAA